MRKDGKKGSTGRTICTRSLASASTEQETPGLRRSTRGTSSTPTKLLTPTSSTRKSERLTPSPASVTKKSGRVEKKTTTSPLRKSDKGKNVSSENSKGSDNSCRNADTSSDIEEIKDKTMNNIEESINKIKKQEPRLTGRSYSALFRNLLKKEVHASSNDKELVVLGCSRRVPAGNDDARDDNNSPHANSESERLSVGKTSLEKGIGFPVKLVRDTEKMVLDSSPVVEAGDVSAIGLPSGNSDIQKLLVNKTSLETDIDFPLKRKRGTAGVVLDASAIVAYADDRVMSSDGVTPSPTVCKTDNQPERCSTCDKRQKVKDDFENLNACSCISQPIPHVAQDMKESGPTTRRDYGEKRQNIQQDKSYDSKFSLIYPEYWVPVQLSDVQLEQYCRILFSKSLTLSSLSKNDLVGALEETLASLRKTCDHPYVMDASLKQLLTKNLELHEILDVEVKASGKLYLLDAMLTQIKTNGLKAVVFYQATQNSEGLLLANILEDFMSQRFGQNSYEHGVSLAKKNAINNFNKESQCFVLLLETRACSQSIKLLRAETFILFGSSLNPSHDVRLLEKIKIESYSERTKIFRLYSAYTVEEKALILARKNKWKNKPLENLNRPFTHALLMWGASYLLEKLDHFHGSETPDSGVPFEQSIRDGVIHEFSCILSSIIGEGKEGKLCLLLETKHAQGTYSTDSTLFGEEHVKLSNEGSPNIFWTKLLEGKNPMWKYCSDTRQRSRKRVQCLRSEEIAKIGNGINIKKQKKASGDVTVDNNEITASGKDHIGALESSNVTTLASSCRSACGTNDILNGNDAFGLYSVGNYISRIPEDMLAGIDWRQFSGISQRIFHTVLKPEMAKLCQVLHLSEESTSMVEKLLEYVIENHRVCEEPVPTLQAFQIALIWIAAFLVGQKLNRKESVVRAKSELGFKCCSEEVDYIYSMLYCMKSLFLEHTQVSQEKNITKLLRNSEGKDCMTGKRGGHNSSATKDIEKAVSYIKKKCKKRLQNLKEKHEGKKLERVNMYADKKQILENEKKVERAIIRIQFRWTSTQSLEDDLKRLDHDHEKKIDKITTERDEGLKSLEQMHEAEKKNLAEDEAYWISRVEKWAHSDLINCGPIKSGSNKHYSKICSSNASKNALNHVQTSNDPNGEATYNTDMACMVSKGNQVPELENTSGTMSGGSSQQVHEMVASRKDKVNFSGQDDQDICPVPSSSGGKQPDPAANFGQNIESAIEPQLAGSPMPSSPGGKQPDPEASIQGKNIEAEPKPAGSPTPSSLTRQQPDPAANIDGQNIDAEMEPQPAESETVETGTLATLEQGNEFACPLLSSPAGNQPDSAANIEDQNINTSAEPQIAGPGAVEIGDSSISDQEIMPDQDACSLPSPLVGTQGDIGAYTESQNITTVTQFQTDGLDALETGGPPVSDQGAVDASTAPGNHPGLNNTTVAEPHITGSDTSEREIGEPGPQVEQSTFANTIAHAQLVHENGVEPSAGVTAPAPSLLNNGMVQSAVQPVPQTPFPVFSDPFQHELEKLRRESENSKKTNEEKKSMLKAEFERKMAEIEAEYQRKLHEIEAEHTARMTKVETSKNLVMMNKLLANVFLSKCSNRNASHPSVAPRGRIQQLAQRPAAQVSALRNYTAPASARLLTPLQPQASSSASRLSGLPLNLAHCPIPEERQPLTSNTAPSLSASFATNPAFNATLPSPAPHVNPYRSSSSIPSLTFSSSLPQAVTYLTVLIQQQQQQQQKLGSGLQTSNDVVCLSDNE